MIEASYFLKTVKNNIDNKKLTDKDFREFTRNTLPSIDMKHLPKERLAILRNTNYDSGYDTYEITTFDTKDRQDTIWNTFTEYGRHKRGMKKCKVIIMEEE